MIEELRIIFWVCMVEAFIGHMPWTAPLAVFGVCLLVPLLMGNAKKKAQEELQESLENFKKRNEKRRNED